MRPKNIWKYIKFAIKLYVAFLLATDLIIHTKNIAENLKPFTSALVSYTKNYAIYARLSRSLSPNDEEAKRARKLTDKIQAYKKLLPLAEKDKKLGKKESVSIVNYGTMGSPGSPNYGTSAAMPNSFPTHSNKSKKQKRILLQIDHDCPEGKELEACLDDLEKEGEVVLESLERLGALTRTKMLELEAEEPELRLELELQSGIFVQQCLSILECLFILFLLFWYGPKKKHLIVLSSTLVFHFLFIIWMGWRLFIRWTKEKTVYNLGFEIGLILDAL